MANRMTVLKMGRKSLSTDPDHGCSRRRLSRLPQMALRRRMPGDV
jgi:hypothetical protein